MEYNSALSAYSLASYSSYNLFNSAYLAISAYLSISLYSASFANLSNSAAFFASSSALAY